MPFFRVLRLIPIALAFAAAPSAATGVRLPTSAAWAMNAAWDGGRAEIATYTATRPVGGKSVTYEATLVTLLKGLDPRSLAAVRGTATDDPPLSVLELTALHIIPATEFGHRILTTTAVRRADPRLLVKLTSSCQESVGNSWKEIRVRDRKASYDWSSPHPGEGDGLQQLNLRAVDLLEDQFPLTLRGLDFEQRPEFMVRLLPTMASSHGGPVKWRKGGIKVTGPETIEVPYGRVSTWKVYVDTAATMSAWWFAVEGTHPLIRMESSEGYKLALQSLEHRAYGD